MHLVSFIQALVVVVMALSLLYFLWGIVMYISRYGDATKRKEGVRIMTQGVLALFVMFAFWGLVAVLVNTFGGSSEFGIPQF